MQSPGPFNAMQFEAQPDDERGAHDATADNAWRVRFEESIRAALSDGSANTDALSLLDGAVAAGFLAERHKVSLGELIDAFGDTGAASWVAARAIDAYVVARSAAVVRWARGLRHDLRNSLGTAGNALALLREEVAPDGGAERLRAMASRNLNAAGAIARARLGDDAVLEQLRSAQQPLGEALRVAASRRPLTAFTLRVEELSAEVAAAEVDVSALLLILSALAAGLPEGATLRVVGADGFHDERAELLVSAPDDRMREWRGLALGDRIARRAGGALASDEPSRGVRVLLPVVRSGNERNNLTRGRERDHRNSESP